MNKKNEIKKVSKNVTTYPIDKRFGLQINLGEQLEETVNEYHKNTFNIKNQKRFNKLPNKFEINSKEDSFSSSSSNNDGYYESFLKNITEENKENTHNIRVITKQNIQKKAQTQLSKDESSFLQGKLMDEQMINKQMMKLRIPKSSPQLKEISAYKAKKIYSNLILPSINKEKDYYKECNNQKEFPYTSIWKRKEENHIVSQFNINQQSQIEEEKDNNDNNDKVQSNMFFVKKQESFSIDNNNNNKPKIIKPKRKESNKSTGRSQNKNSINQSNKYRKNMRRSVFLTNCSGDLIQKQIKKFSISPINLPRKSKELIIRKLTVCKKNQSDKNTLPAPLDNLKKTKKLKNSNDNLTKPLFLQETIKKGLSDQNTFCIQKKKKSFFCGCIPIN